MESSRSDSIAEPHHNMQDYDTNSPPNSRLFVVCSKTFSEDDIREIFSSHGEIQDVYIIRDKTPSRASKGVCFIKFYKSSDACKAMEELNGKHVKDSERPIKVLMAQSRTNERSWSYPSGGSNSHGLASSRGAAFATEEEQLDNLLRLFVTVDKKQTQEQIKNYFQKFGIVDHVHILKDKESGESRGVAYVKFYRASHAAQALEEAAPEYKAILADPRPPKGGPVIPSNQSYTYSVGPYNSHNTFAVPNMYGSKNGAPPNDSVGHHSMHHPGYQPPVFGYSSNGLSPNGAPPITPLFPPAPPPTNHPHALSNAGAAGAGLTAMLQMAACGDDGAVTSWISPPHPAGNNPAPTNLTAQVLPSYEHINMACRTLGYSSCRILATVDPRSSESQLRGIFDLIPGLESFRLGGDNRKQGSNGNAYVNYATPFAAYYASQKLNGLEFPPGFKITAKHLDDTYSDSNSARYTNNNVASNMSGPAHIMNLQMSRAMLLGHLGAVGNINTMSMANGPSLVKNGSPKTFQSTSVPMPTMGTGDSQEMEMIVNGARGFVYQPAIHTNAVSASAESYPSFTSSSSGGSASNGPTLAKNSSTGNLQNQGSADQSGRKTKRGLNNGGSNGNQNRRNNSTGALKNSSSSNNGAATSQSQQRNFVSSSASSGGSTGNVVSLTNGAATAAAAATNGSY